MVDVYTKVHHVDASVDDVTALHKDNRRRRRGGTGVTSLYCATRDGACGDAFRIKAGGPSPHGRRSCRNASLLALLPIGSFGIAEDYEETVPRIRLNPRYCVFR